VEVPDVEALAGCRLEDLQCAAEGSFGDFRQFAKRSADRGGLGHGLPCLAPCSAADDAVHQDLPHGVRFGLGGRRRRIGAVIEARELLCKNARLAGQFGPHEGATALVEGGRVESPGSAGRDVIAGISGIAGVGVSVQIAASVTSSIARRARLTAHKQRWQPPVLQVSDQVLEGLGLLADPDANGRLGYQLRARLLESVRGAGHQHAADDDHLAVSEDQHFVFRVEFNVYRQKTRGFLDHGFGVEGRDVVFGRPGRRSKSQRGGLERAQRKP
jgi:hypothetical protein